MGIFFTINEKLINFDSLADLIQDNYRPYFGRPELAPYILAEICALDMLYTVVDIRGGYYGDRLVLKGGHSVRNYVPLVDHRFSFDADFNVNSFNGFTYGDVDEIRKDLISFGSLKGCKTKTHVTQDSNLLYFLQINYHDEFRRFGQSIIEAPKIEICKTCRTLEKPTVSTVNTMIDLRLLGLEPLVLTHLSLEEQLADKLYIIGALGRQRNNFDAYDVYRICHNNSVNWKKTKNIFEKVVEKSGKRMMQKHIDECIRHLDTMLLNVNKRKNLTDVLFDPRSFDFGEMVSFVKSTYDFK
jgi:predicted nucleotidyltransferase component of viral defense system